MEHQLFIEGKNYNEELGLYIIFPENKNENFEFNDNGIILVLFLSLNVSFFK